RPPASEVGQGGGGQRDGRQSNRSARGGARDSAGVAVEDQGGADGLRGGGRGQGRCGHWAVSWAGSRVANTSPVARSMPPSGVNGRARGKGPEPRAQSQAPRGKSALWPHWQKAGRQGPASTRA